ncbi:DUF2188 domain-containing protein [Mycoplasma marinum]|uniref:DUF2188 domain-containing protein n=1 Tax=Mycoplasma marinum TaxID=1937190 RepID=A0A4R0XKK3_9MOLU|nr:DUF2188 domain-containing protein [Mycoplasma marinum]TCG11186.1 hypothetical protein C4B24_02790 [Mycoplasma marinum]
MAKDVMVQQNDDGKWLVRTTGSQRALKLFLTQKEASEYGKLLAKKNQSEFRMKDKKGKVRETISYKK